MNRVVAQQEREAISLRTREALRDAVVRNTDEFALALRPVVEAIRAEGSTTLRAMAEQLNDRGIATPTGGRWQLSNVRNLLAKLDYEPHSY